MFTTTRAVIAGCTFFVGILAIHGPGAAVLSAAASSVVFDGLPHTAIGDTILRLDGSRKALEILPFDLESGDGVRVGLPETKSWTARMSAAEAVGSPFQVAWDARADGRVISSASMRQNGSRLELKGAFTGGIKPTYSAQVYAGGQLVASLGSVPPTAPIAIPVWWCYTLPEIFDCGFTIEFHNSANSECEFRFGFDTRVPFTLPNGAVAMGDELRLVEEVKPAAHYPYLSFDAIDVRSNSRLLTVFSETFR